MRHDLKGQEVRENESCFAWVIDASHDLTRRMLLVLIFISRRLEKILISKCTGGRKKERERGNEKDVEKGEKVVLFHLPPLFPTPSPEMRDKKGGEESGRKHQAYISLFLIHLLVSVLTKFYMGLSAQICNVNKNPLSKMICYYAKLLQ